MAPQIGGTGGRSAQGGGARKFVPKRSAPPPPVLKDYGKG